MMINRGKLKFNLHTGWSHLGDFTQDGKVVNVAMNYKLDNGEMIRTLDFQDSITTDQEGNIIWNCGVRLTET